MATVILICGKICSGKSTYAEKLRRQRNAVLLSCDEIMLTLFGRDLGEQHDRIAERTQHYLFQKSLEILGTGTNVILDWGFWTAKNRTFVRTFYREHGIPQEWHYVDVSDRVWQKNLTLRNQAVLNGQVDAYLVDEGLTQKFEHLFEKPAQWEINVWLQNKWI